MQCQALDDQRPKKWPYQLTKTVKRKMSCTTFWTCLSVLSNFRTFRVGFLPYTAKNKNSNYSSIKKIRIRVGPKITWKPCSCSFNNNLQSNLRWIFESALENFLLLRKNMDSQNLGNKSCNHRVSIEGNLLIWNLTQSIVTEKLENDVMSDYRASVRYQI